jgi:hypothetical protein
MNSTFTPPRWMVALALLFPAAAFAGKSTPDITSPLKRQVTVKLAEEFAHRPPPPAVPADLVSPFNPPDFEKADPAETPANVASGGRAPVTPSTAGGGTTPTPKAVPISDRVILEAVASKIPVTGSMVGRDGKPILTGTSGKKFYVGSTFTVTDGAQDYDLEVVAIDRTTFTLRYRGEEITRNIRHTK